MSSPISLRAHLEFPWRDRTGSRFDRLERGRLAREVLPNIPCVHPEVKSEKTGFAVRRKMPTLGVMENPKQVFEAARHAGIDLDLVDTNLSLSVGERWSQHNGALDLIVKLEQARKNLDAKLQPIVAAPR